MKHLDLFSGIGGFALAASSVWGSEYENAGFCDIEPFAQAIIKKHWPSAKIYDDIKKLSGKDIGPVDLVTGGFPCQPFSAAGKRRGKEDDRHLWPEMLRVIRETTPRWIIGENVGGLLTWNGGMVLDEVFSDLEAEGYEVWAFVIPACAVGAPHRRDRVWITAHAIGSDARGATRELHGPQEKERLQKRDEVGQSGEPSEVRLPSDSRRKYGKGKSKRGELEGSARTGDAFELERPDESNRARTDTNANSDRLQESRSELQTNRDRQPDEAAADTRNEGPQRGREERVGYGGQRDRDGRSKRRSWEENWLEVAAELCVVDDGLPDGSPRPSGWRNAALKGAGNAIVPQVAMMIMEGIKSIDDQ